MAPKKPEKPKGIPIYSGPEPPDLQDVLNEIDNLKRMLGSTQETITSIRKSIAELTRIVTDLDDRLDQ